MKGMEFRGVRVWAECMPVEKEGGFWAPCWVCPGRVSGSGSGGRLLFSLAD